MTNLGPQVLPALLELAGDIWCQLDYFFAGSICSAGVPVISPFDQTSDADRALLNLVAAVHDSSAHGSSAAASPLEPAATPRYGNFDIIFDPCPTHHPLFAPTLPAPWGGPCLVTIAVLGDHGQSDA